MDPADRTSDAYHRKQRAANLEGRLRREPDPAARRILASTLAAIRRGADLELAAAARRRAWDCYLNEDEPDGIIERLEADLAAATPQACP